MQKARLLDEVAGHIAEAPMGGQKPGSGQLLQEFRTVYEQPGCNASRISTEVRPSPAAKCRRPSYPKMPAKKPLTRRRKPRCSGFFSSGGDASTVSR